MSQGTPGQPGQPGNPNAGTGGAGGLAGLGGVGGTGVRGETGARGPEGGPRPWWKSVVPYVALVLAVTFVQLQQLQESLDRTKGLCELGREVRMAERAGAVTLVRFDAQRARPAAEAIASQQRAQGYLAEVFGALPDLDCSRTVDGKPVKVPVPVPEAPLAPPLGPPSTIVLPPPAKPPVRTAITTAPARTPSPATATPPTTVAPTPSPPAPPRDECETRVLGLCVLG